MLIWEADRAVCREFQSIFVLLRIKERKTTSLNCTPCTTILRQVVLSLRTQLDFSLRGLVSLYTWKGLGEALLTVQMGKPGLGAQGSGSCLGSPWCSETRILGQVTNL